MAPTKKRRLRDLYVTGREFKVDDGSGEPVVVWIQKLTQLEHEAAMRRAGAAKARLLMHRNDPDSETWQAVYSDVDEMTDRDALLSYVLAEELSKVAESREAELAAEEEWEKDNYLQGLKDAWFGDETAPGLKDVYIDEEPQEGEEPSARYAEAKEVWSELKRFDETVDEKVQAERKRLVRDYENVSMEELRRQVVDKFLEIRAGSAWVREFRRCEVMYAVRDPENHDEYYFAPEGKKEPSREEVDQLAPETFGQLARAIDELTVDPTEGKDSEPTPDSSDLSASPGEPETAPTSGPLELVR
jgi:hypothetical protein